MAEADYLGEHVPESCEGLLDVEANELRSEIPALARDKSRMGEVEKADPSLPSEHDLYRGDSRDLYF